MSDKREPALAPLDQDTIPQALPKTLISEIAQRCSDLFKALIAALGPDVPLTGRLITDYSQRFTSWNGFLGVSALGSLSLDHRLRNAAEVRSLVVHQVLLLERNLFTG